MMPHRMRLLDGHATRLAASLAVWFVSTIGISATHRGSTGTYAPPSSLLRIVHVSENPIALAVDTRTGRVFVVGNSGGVNVLDATTGSIVRTVAVGRSAQAVAVDEATGRAFVTNQARAFTLDAHTGAIARALSLGGGVAPGLAVEGRHGEIFIATRGAPASNPVVPPHRGVISVLDATTGRLRRTVPVEADLLAVDGVARRIVVPYACARSDASTEDACADTFDATTGRRLKTVDLGGEQGYAQGITAVAVDARAGSAVVLYGDGRGNGNVGVVATRTGTLRGPGARTGGALWDHRG